MLSEPPPQHPPPALPRGREAGRRAHHERGGDPRSSAAAGVAPRPGHAILRPGSFRAQDRCKMGRARCPAGRTSTSPSASRMAPAYRRFLTIGRGPAAPDRPRLAHGAASRAAIARGKPGHAEYLISELRDHTLALMCLRLGESTAYAKGVDRLPTSVTNPVADTLVRSLTARRGRPWQGRGWGLGRLPRRILASLTPGQNNAAHP